MEKGSNKARNTYYVLTKAFNYFLACQLVNYDVTSYEFGLLPPAKIIDGCEKERCDLPFFMDPDATKAALVDPSDFFLNVTLCIMALGVLPINAKYLRPSGLTGACRFPAVA